MHERLLAAASAPHPTVIMGLLMRPYSLGHELFLHREDSPILDPGRPVSREDLAEALFICSNSWSQNHKAATQWLTGLKLSIITHRVKPAKAEAVLAAFLTYRRLAMRAFPESQITRADGNRSERIYGSPLILRLAQFLQLRLGMSAEQAWDTHYGLACMQWEACMETDGKFDVYNEHEYEFDAYAAKQDALRQEGALSRA